MAFFHVIDGVFKRIYTVLNVVVAFLYIVCLKSSARLYIVCQKNLSANHQAVAAAGTASVADGVRQVVLKLIAASCLRL